MTTTRRLFIFNFAGACLVAWAWSLGYVQRVTEADGAHMTLIIAALFAAGLVSTAWSAVRVDTASKRLVHDETMRPICKRVIANDSAHLYDVFAGLFILGIIGNAIGFLSAFGGIDIAALSTPEGFRKAGSQLLSGSGTAFGSTIVGLSLALWMSANLRILATGIERLSND